MKNKLGFNITLATQMKILGYLVRDKNFWPLNLILMTTRKYIFWCLKNNFHLNIHFLPKEVKKTYGEQKTLSKVNSQSDFFNRQWEFWKNLFIALTTAIPYFTIQINPSLIDCNEFKISYAVLCVNSTNLLLLLLFCKNYIGSQFSTE